MAENSNIMAEKKLILLYIVERMGIPISNGQIAQIVIEKNLMDYFTMQVYLDELTKSKQFSVTKETNQTRYNLTDEGKNTLLHLIQRIPGWIKHEINQYVIEHKNAMRAEFEMSANYFLTANNDYLVKLGVYEYDGTALMEINVSVGSKEQSRIICNNWKDNINSLYGKILSDLINIEKQSMP